ncbi:MAG: LysR family transcriptional regulator [Candidatus Levyibacteriota bacterium]
MNEDLQRFLIVARESSLTKTAEKLFLTQSALTQSIHRLEKQLKTKLFTHQGKHLHLTDDGKALVVIGTRMAQLWNTATSPQKRSLNKLTYTLGLFDNVALQLGNFFQTHMQTDAYKLELTISSSSKLLNQLQLGTLDAALCVLQNKIEIPIQCELMQTFSEKLLPVSAKTFSGKLETIPFILYNQGSHTRNQIDQIFRKRGIDPVVFAESTSVTLMKELALLGSGVAILPENTVRQEIGRGALKEQKIPLHWTRNYGLVLQRQGTLTKDHPIIKDLLKNL